MSRLAIPTLDTLPEASRPLLAAVQTSLGSVPNLFRLAGQSPVALGALLGLSGAMTASLDPRTRERIALAVAEVNGCAYCLSAHSYIGQNLVGLDAAEIARNRSGRSADPKADAAVAFAARVARARGRVTDEDLAGVRRAGFTEAQIIEIVGHVALNVFTNFLNNVAETDIDFPVVHPAVAA